ncbi:MAG: flagellar hook-associated protein FlgK [Alphaproteobacteria bacterium]|nr:flagellar hook-associated protein FlgK [Alphaproteobacteria bacterium]
MSTSITTALSGLSAAQAGLEVVSRNVANAGTPGYNKQSLALVDTGSGSNWSARVQGVQRAFDQALQSQVNLESGRAGYTSVMADFLSRLDLQLGRPGEPNSLDSVFSRFENGLNNLTASPDDYATRATFMADATSIVGTLNYLSDAIQTLRGDAEARIASDVSDLNRMLPALADINAQLADSTIRDAGKAALLDERDRLIGEVGQIVDIRVSYDGNGAALVQTQSGLGLVDALPTRFEFARSGGLAATISQEAGNIGTLRATTAAGMDIDILANNVLQSGRLAGLFELRDEVLVTAQAQIDEVAAGLAQAMSSVSVPGTAVSQPGGDGFEIDLSGVQPGNSFLLNYVENGNPVSVNVVRVDDPAKLPMDMVDANGVRTIGLDFSGGVGAVATALQTALGPGLAITNPSGAMLEVLDDGLAGTTDVSALSASVTSTVAQGAGMGLNLFIDEANGAFTNSLDGQTQKLGFASRIRINSAIVADNALLVQFDAGTSLGDATRPNYLLDQLRGLKFDVDGATGFSATGYGSSGNVLSIIQNTLNYQGNSIAAAEANQSSQSLIMDAIGERVSSATGVNVDEEMARLMELQTAYAANARVVTIVKELMAALMAL